MSETHYWPTEPGTYLIATGEGYDDEWTLGVDGKWSCEAVPIRKFTTARMAADGYLGVRREKPEPVNQAEPDAESSQDALHWRAAVKHGIEVTVDGVAIGKATYWEDSGDSSVGIPATGGWELTGSNIGELSNKASRGDDLNALVREAITEFRRDVKQPTKAADWAFRWANRFIEAVES